MKFLIIDDERSIRETLEMFLREKGYAVACSENGERGLEAVESEHPDVVILDIRLPGVSGLEVLKKIKAMERDIMVVMITAYHDMGTALQVMTMGAFEYIRKPIDLDAFEIVIEKVVHRFNLGGQVGGKDVECSSGHNLLE
ncbi:MAG: response regulator [Deltaproteobacteria bacterium]|nr:response regulator [Deltaproteobacteria bacterium]